MTRKRRSKVISAPSEQLKEQIRAFKLDTFATEFSFPPTLNGEERSEISQYAAKIGVKSSSQGRGMSINLNIKWIVNLLIKCILIEPNRFIKLLKAAQIKEAVNKKSPALELSAITVITLKNFLETQPLEADTAPHHLKSKDQDNIPLPFSFGSLKKQLYAPSIEQNEGPFKDTRESLPIYLYRQEILDVIAANQVVVISGETGRCH